jgi:hypothetical protein
MLVRTGRCFRQKRIEVGKSPQWMKMRGVHPLMLIPLGLDGFRANSVQNIRPALIFQAHAIIISSIIRFNDCSGDRIRELQPLHK